VIAEAMAYRTPVIGTPPLAQPQSDRYGSVTKPFDVRSFNKLLLRKIGLVLSPKITAKVAALRCRIFEVGVSYYGRTYEVGKKAGWKDGIHAIWLF
jgi:hypothetical protein